MEHTEVTPGEVHTPYQWVVANEAARLALVPEGAYDLHKLCLQTDTDPATSWRLKQVSPPLWEAFGGAGTPGPSVWGEITGDLTTQTDLNNALTGKAHKTGFPENTSGQYLCDLTYNETTRTVTLTPTSTSFDVFVGGVKYTFTGAQSIQHGTAYGPHYVYVNASGTIVTTAGAENAWDILLHAPIAYIFWDSANSRGICFEERHHAGRDLYWHRNQHVNEGTKASSGFAISGYTVNDGSTDAVVTWALASGRLEDEDIRVDTEAISDNGPYNILKRVGASGNWQAIRDVTLPFLFSGNNLQYNQNNGGTWQDTNVPEDNFINVFVVGMTALPANKYTPSTDNQIWIIPGQTTYTTEAAAHAESFSTLSLQGLPIMEWAALYQITLRYNATAPSAFVNTARCAVSRVLRIVGNSAVVQAATQQDHGGQTGLLDDDHLQYAMANPLAAAVTYTPSGTTTITLDGGRTEVFTATVATGATTWAFSNPVATGKVSSFGLELTNGGLFTQTWPAAVKWAGGTAPTLTSSGLDILEFYTRDGGTTWRGFVAAKDSK